MKAKRLPLLLMTRTLTLSLSLSLLSPGPLTAQPEPGPGGQPLGEMQGRRALNGFAGVEWGSNYAAVRRYMIDLATADASTERIEIVREEPERMLLVRRNDVIYRYNFYKTPFEVMSLEDRELVEEQWEDLPGRLYHVKVMIPLIKSEEIKDRLEQQFGPNAITTLREETRNEEGGADIWELEGGLVMLWYEPYRETLFTRNIDYLGEELAGEIMRDYEQWFDHRERRILRDLLLR